MSGKFAVMYLFLLELGTAAAQAGPTAGVISKTASAPTAVSNEFLVDTSVVFGPAPANQDSAAVAFDGTNFFVVWQDRRNGNYDIYGTRVTPSGTVLDPVGIPISTGPGDQAAPAIGFDGVNFLVVWQDRRTVSFDWDVYATRVTATGAVLDPDGFPVETHTNAQSSPAVAFDGTNYLVVWRDGRDDQGDIYGALVKPAGTIIATIEVETGTGVQSSPAVACNGSYYFVVWQDQHGGATDIYGSRLSATGTVLDPTPIQVSTAAGIQELPALAFDRTNYLVAWEDHRQGDSARVYGARVSPAGTVEDPAGIAIADRGAAPAVAFDGANYLVTTHRAGMKGIRLSPAGAVLDPTPFTISAGGSFGSVAWGDTSYLAAWQDVHIYGARLTGQGQVLNPKDIALSTSAHAQETPAVAFDGENYCAVWSDFRASRAGIFGARVRPDGRVLDPAGFALRPGTGDQASPAIAFGDTNYLVAWEDYGKGFPSVCAVRLTPAGTVVDGQPRSVSPASIGFAGRPSVAFDGTNYFVVWSGFKSGTLGLYGSRLDRTGTVLDPDGILISQRNSWTFASAVAFDGANYLVVWDDGNIYGNRVSPAGTVLGSRPFEIPKSPSDPANPRVTFDGSNYLVVWQDYPDDIYGARVAPSGTVLGTADILISTGTGFHGVPAIAFDGTQHVVAWEDSTAAGRDLSGATVNPVGTVSGPFSVSDQDGDQSALAIGRGPSDQVLLVYQGWTAVFDGKPFNSQRIWGKFYPRAGVDERPAPVREQPVLRLSPRPAKSYFLIRSPSPIWGLKIYEASGRAARKESYSRQPRIATVKIDLKGFSSGIYFVTVETAEGIFKGKILVIK